VRPKVSEFFVHIARVHVHCLSEDDSRSEGTGPYTADWCSDGLSITWEMFHLKSFDLEMEDMENLTRHVCLGDPIN
jgi:hypothetical protein